jgi:two-component system sensor histidine kinase/response regulator
MPTSEPSKRVLVIDDEDVILLSCRRILEKDGFNVETFDSGRLGVERAQAFAPQVVLVDLKMPEMDGFEVIAKMRALNPDIVIAVITGYATIGTAVEAMRAGAFDFLPKPFTPDELRLFANRCFEHWRLVMDAKESRRAKAEFERHLITFVSHQLKSPIVAVKQYLDVLLVDSTINLPETVREWMTRSRVRLAEMLAMIDDWLTFAKIEQGTLAQSAVTSDLRAIVAQVVQAVSGQAQSAGVTVTVQDMPNLPAVCGDSVALGVVVQNLVTNGIKYNRPQGRVIIRTERQESLAMLSVADTGIGIAEDDLPFLFTEFFRVKASETRNISGTGLGLAICKRIVSELHGTIEVTSKLGQGTTFVVRLPLAPPCG